MTRLSLIYAGAMAIRWVDFGRERVEGLAASLGAYVATLVMCRYSVRVDGGSERTSRIASRDSQKFLISFQTAGWRTKKNGPRV